MKRPAMSALIMNMGSLVKVLVIIWVMGTTSAVGCAAIDDGTVVMLVFKRLLFAAGGLQSREVVDIVEGDS